MVVSVDLMFVALRNLDFKARNILSCLGNCFKLAVAKRNIFFSLFYYMFFEVVDRIGDFFETLLTSFKGWACPKAAEQPGGAGKPRRSNTLYEFFTSKSQ